MRPGVAGGKRKTASVGGGETSHRQSWTHTGDRCISSPCLWTSCCQGSPGLEQVGLPPGKEASRASTGAGPPAWHGGSEIKLAHGFPTHAGHRCLLSGGHDAILFYSEREDPKFRAGSGGTAVEHVPGALTAGHVTRMLPAGPRRRGPSCKVTLEAGTRTPAALGAGAHSQNGAVLRCPKLGTG